jgi:predicted nucleic acid-binding protein
MSYLLDTNVISELVRSKPNARVVQWIEDIPDEMLYLSVLSLGEIRKGVEGILDLKRREKIRLWLEHELPEWLGSRVLPIDKLVADRWGRLQHDLKGRPLPTIDSLLAATALSYDLRLVTRNVKDFDYYPLETINPWDAH